MSIEYLPGVEDTLMDRRRFLKAAAVSAALGTVAGSGAALLWDGGSPTAAPQTLPPARSVPYAPAAGESTSELLARIASLKAENVSLASQLSIAQGRLEASRGLGDPGKTANEALQAQLAEAESRAGGLAGQLGVLAGLVALYEELEQIDLAAVVEAGLSSVGELVDELSGQIPAVSLGLAASQKVLDELEEELPRVQEGWSWMRDQALRVGGLFKSVELALANATEAVGDFLLLLGEWFQSLLKWLPFGMGKRAVTTMAAMTDLLAELPVTLDGLDQRVAAPLAAWLEQDEGQARLQKRVIKPVREQALEPAQVVVTKAGSLQSAYRENLRRPVESLSEQRLAIRGQIDQYRQTHRL
jgi:hypothetical protein